MKQKIPLLVTVIFFYLSLKPSTSDATATRDCPLGDLRVCGTPCDDRATNPAGPCPDGQLCCSTCCRDSVVACLVDEVVKHVGDEFTEDDGCNTCTCQEDGSIACTDNSCTTDTLYCPADRDDGSCDTACGEDSLCVENQRCCSGCCQVPVVACIVDGIVKHIGAEFPASDGCNTCRCTDNGDIACTEIGCTPPPPQGCPIFRNSTSDTTGGGIGTCVAGCNINAEQTGCDEGLRCCMNGCGTTCVKPVTVCEARNGVLYQVGDTIVSADGCNTCSCDRSGVLSCTNQTCPPVMGCPRIASGTPGTCADVNNNICNDVTLCANADQICCTGSDGCGVCIIPVTVCTSSDGIKYQVGETFPSEDGCNNCTCLSNGRVVCTLRSCIDRCYLRPQGGDCSATRYFFEPSTSRCLSYTGACESEEEGNNFDSLRACHERCNPRSVCNADIYPPGFVARCDVLAIRWTFNATTNECEEIRYRACGEESDGYNVFDDRETCSNTCMRLTNPVCPDDNLVNCFADPCDTSRCNNFPNARCESNFCGGCNAYYFDSDGNNVTEGCSTVDTCADGSPRVSCFADPCDQAICPEFPEARCVSNNCGGCNYNFFNEVNQDVTRQCSRVVPVPLIAKKCPFHDQSLGGICVESCGVNAMDCTDDELCCLNGCGSTCMTPTRIPYYRIPFVCPQIEFRDLFGTCALTDRSCSFRYECDDNELCCGDRCGERCTRAVRSNNPCFAVVDQIFESLFGTNVLSQNTFIPSCKTDGTFLPVQCDSSNELCWCVDTESGFPITSYSPRGTRPSCAGCRFNREDYGIGETFPDGCNMCICTESGQVSCTIRECPDPCTLPADPGPCRASIPAFYYDQGLERCMQFTYGGCDGNENKFRSVRDCLQTCNPNSVCLREPQPCDIEDRSYFFNSTSGQCERHNRGGCDQRENVFTTASECFVQCSPEAIPIDRCLDVICAIPVCEREFEVVSDDQHCCPYCSPIVQCDDQDYRCADGTCIPDERVCDGLRDCKDGADEEGCEAECEFICGDKTSIPCSQVCDGVLDCSDGADVHNCTEDFLNVYYLTDQDIPRLCPNIADSLGSCVTECDNDDSCRDGTNCCRNGCGRTCVVGIEYRPLCPSILRQSEQSDRLGVFRPSCEGDGTFSAIQCHGSNGYCWCVDVDSGQPISEGVRGEEPVCRGCRTVEGKELAVGDSFRSEDGCNTCICTGGNNIICTRKACDDAPCRFQNRMVPSNTTFDDECNTCFCFAGSFKCTRKACVRAGTPDAVRQNRLITARLPFAGNFDAIKNRIEDFIREVRRSFLIKYSETLGIIQEQIQKIEVMEGSVIIIVTLADSNSTTTGANLTVLIGQVQQDFEEELLVIRYDDQILTPSGEFQTDQAESSASLLTWHIIVIVVGILIVLSVVVVILIFVVLAMMKKKSGGENKHEQYNEPNEYELPSATRMGHEEKKQLS